MTLVKDLVKKSKSKKVATIDPETDVQVALNELKQMNTGILLVTDDTEVLGVFSEKQYARKLLFEEAPSPFTLVRHVMNEDVVFVELDNTVEDCLIIMYDKGIKNLPVMDNGELISFISMKDVMESIVDGKDFLINQLTQYITGGQVIHQKMPPADETKAAAVSAPAEYKQKSL